PTPPALMRRQPSPMQVDGPSQPPGPRPVEPSSSAREERRQKHISWDFSLRKGFNELDIANATPPKETPPWMPHAPHHAPPGPAAHASYPGVGPPPPAAHLGAPQQLPFRPA